MELYQRGREGRKIGREGRKMGKRREIEVEGEKERGREIEVEGGKERGREVWDRERDVCQ